MTTYSNQERSIKRIAILGGGATGWTAAAALVKGLQGMGVSIVLVDSDLHSEIDLHCEITTPACVGFHHFLGISEQDLMAATGSSFLLATQFSAWANDQQNYFMPFSDHGFMLNRIEFPQYAFNRHHTGSAINFDDFSLASAAAKLGRFCHPSAQESSLFSTLSYGLSLNLANYQNYLRQYAMHFGVEYIHANIGQVKLHTDGYIDSIALDVLTANQNAAFDSANSVSADLFIDCTGINGEIISKALNVGWISAAQQLPVSNVLSNQVVVEPQSIPSHRTLNVAAVGWTQNIYTQTKTEQQYFYHSDFISDDQANVIFGANSADLKTNQLKLGRRTSFWIKNCIAIGEAACNLDVLGTGKLHLVQSAILRLISLFPKQIDAVFNPSEYNRLTHLECDHIEDFHVLHYQLANPATEYWQQVKNATLSNRLIHKMELYKERGVIAFYEGETFSTGTWTSLLLGNGVWPRRYDPLVHSMDADWIDQQLNKMKKMIHSAADAMPLQKKYLIEKKFTLTANAVLN